jgi:sarcosine oxidase subunit beta
VRSVIETADVIIVGAGVQGASLAFHLARRGTRVVVVERATVAGGATGRSSGFVRMHYDLESEARLAWAAYPYFRDWAERVGEGDCAFVRTGFVQLVPPELADSLRANVAMHRAIGIPSEVVGPDEVARLMPGIVTGDVVAAAYEPESGYADPTMTATGLLAAARRDGARLLQGAGPARVLVDGDRVAGVETARGRIAAPVVVDVAGAWAAELARTAGLEIPVEAWRHDTGFFGLPDGRPAGFPVVIDHAGWAYFRPEGRDMMLVGLESGNVVGGSPDRPLQSFGASTVETMIDAVCARVPWMAEGTFRTAHGGQDGITPDQRPILGAAGPEGFFLDCGHSGTGFKTAPAVGACMAEVILDGRASTVDISGYALERFAAGRRLEGEHPYGNLWR